jgi:hypothetical protein
MEELGEREKLGDVFAPEGASLLRAHLEPKQAVRVTPQSSLPVAAYLCSAVRKPALRNPLFPFLSASGKDRRETLVLCPEPPRLCPPVPP